MRNNKDIVVGDKNSSIVIMDKKDYVNKFKEMTITGTRK